MIIGELAVQLSLKGAPEITSQLIQINQQITVLNQNSQNAGRGINALEGSLLILANRALNMVGAAFRYAFDQLQQFTSGAFAAAKSYDGLVRGLAGVSGNAQNLTAELRVLREIAKLPGLGFEEAIQGAVRLQATGINVDLATRALNAFGNALALVGKGKTQLDFVTLALSQMATKGKIDGGDIRQIAEQVPQIRAAMLGAFGTGDSESLSKAGISSMQFIKGIVGELEKLPRLTRSIQNDLENLSDRWKMILLSVGQGLAAMFSAAGPAINEFLDSIEEKAKQIGEVLYAIGTSGVLAEAANNLVASLTGLLGGNWQDAVIAFAAGLLSILSNLPRTISDIVSAMGGFFTALIHDIGLAFEQFDKFLNGLMNRVTGWASAVLGALEKAGQFKLPEARGILAAASAEANQQARLGKMESPEDFFSLPGFLKVTQVTNPARDFGRFFDQIKGALQPVPQLPDNLIYGTAPDLQTGNRDTGKDADSLLNALERIANNTRKAADELSLRRQALGGGPLGRAGVTPAEMNGGLINALTNSRPAVSSLQQQLNRMSQGQILISGGGGFRPR